MQAPDRQQRLCALRDIIADIERKPALADSRQSVIEADRERFPDLAAGLFQEVFTDSTRNGGASFGFALEQSKTLLTPDRKSTRLNSSHVKISYAVFCLKKKKT